MPSFIIYPAIDIRNGKCVQLVQGDYNKETVYYENPLEVALQWEASGAEWLHLVDLDGAKAGHPVNHELIGEIASQVKIPVQTGGGLRSRKDVDLLLSYGVSRAILGTSAIENELFVSEVLKHYGEQIAIGLDARNGFLATRGWVEDSTINAEELAVKLAGQGARHFIYTDISRDGMMAGPNVDSIVSLARVTGQSVVASGGVSNYEDLTRLAAHRQDGVSGAIIGTALYVGEIGLNRAIQLVNGN